MATTRKTAQTATATAEDIAVKALDATLFAGTEVEFARRPVGLCSVRLVDVERVPLRIFNKGKASEQIDPEHFCLTFELWSTDWTMTQNVYWFDQTRRDKWLQRLDNATGNKTRKLQTLPEILEYLQNNWTGAQIKEFWNEKQRKNIIFLDWDISGAEEKQSKRK